MLVFVPRESEPGEPRVPLIPETVSKLVKKGIDIHIEQGMGQSCHFDDSAYEAAGASITSDRSGALATADLVLRLRKPPADEAGALKKGALHVSFLDPFNEGALVDALAAQGVTAISMEMMPRTTIAQKMDALSSQANIAGYYAVLIGASRLKKVLPMMMTPAGTLKPARVFIIGAGVAGLQAIATAKRLGARVEAFDTRPVVKEQVQSLGAKFVEVDLGDTGQTAGGYAKELTTEQQEMQRAAMAKVCAQSDIVITTAKLFGRKAPIIITKDMIAGMQPGSVVVDLAIDSGGNVEGAELGKEVDVNGVTLVGIANLEGLGAVHASQMYSSNLGNFIEHFWDAENKTFKFDLKDEILAGCVLTHDGQIVNEMLKNVRAAAQA